MDFRVTFTEQPTAALERAGEFLISRPVLHNLILTLLHARVRQPEPGRYWTAERDGRVAGFVFQSPLNFAAQVTPMSPEVVEALVHAIADRGDGLPGVGGEAATAASFAGQWSERRKSAATPVKGMRLYELGQLAEMGAASGKLRRALPDDRELLIDWLRAYLAEVQEPAGDCAQTVDRWTAAGQLWVWDAGKAVSIAVSREPVAGVARVSNVYTPPEYRRRGYAGCCVHALSHSLQAEDLRCVLYTDLENATSNSVYRRIGYRAVAEALRYRFD